MMLARMLQHAGSSGVQVLAYDINWQLQPEGGAALWGKKLAVKYGPDVKAAEIDWRHLEEVLEFNATDPRTHWKSKQKGVPTEGEGSLGNEGKGAAEKKVPRKRSKGAKKIAGSSMDKE